MKQKKEGLAKINFVLHRDDVPLIEELREEMIKEATDGNTKRVTTLFEMLVTATIFEERLKGVPRVEDIKIKGTLTV